MKNKTTTTNKTKNNPQLNEKSKINFSRTLCNNHDARIKQN